MMVLRLMNVFFRNVKSLKEGLNARKKEIEDLKVITVLLNSRDTVKVENEIYALRVSLENLKKEVQQRATKRTSRRTITPFSTAVVLHGKEYALTSSLNENATAWVSDGSGPRWKT